MKTSFSFLLTVLFSSLVFAQRPATILSFSPQGTTKEPHQVRAEFSEDIVNFGDPRGPMPFDGNCVKKGSGRWIDTRNWVFDFKSPLVGGEKCRFVLKDIKTLKGNTFAAASIFNFDTGGPSIVATQPNEWDGISEDQVFILFLDAVPQLESVKAKAHFVVKGIGDKIPVRIMDQAVAEPLLREASKNRYRAGQHLEIIKGKLVIKKPVLVIQAARAFPKKGEVSLVWDKGTLAASGAATPSRQISEFKIKEGFKVQFSCEREAPEKPCVPIASISVTFSEPVENEMAMKVQLKGPGGKVVKPSGGETKSKKATVYSVEFKPPFEMSAQYEVVLPAGFKNDIGDKPINLNRFPLKFKTSDAPALLKFAADFGIIEMSPEAALPVTLRNLEETIATSIRGEKIPLSGNVMKLDESRAIDIPRWLSKVSRDSVSADSLFSGSDKLDVKKISIKKPAGAKAFEVVGIPFSKPGFYVVEMESKKIGETLGGIDGGKNRTFIRSAALVTKMAVHAKRSHDQALVWVTDLQSTAPVADAQVIAFSCDGKTIASGKTDSKGLVTLTGKFEENLAKSCNELFEGYSSYGQGVYFVAAKGDDRSFTHSSWDQGIENWRFQLGYYDGQDSVNVIAHTVLDRSLFKPREKVHMRHVVRVGTQKGFELLKDSDLPKAIKLVHSSGEQEFEVPVKWNAKAGIADLTWDIPENARMGSWSISFTSGERTYHTGSFQVEQFRIPILRARVQGPDKPAVRVSSVPITVGVEYLAGGPASDLAINLQWQTEDRGVIVADEDYAGFAYLNGSPTLGINRVKSTIDEKKTISGNQSAKLDGAGALTAEIKDLPVTSTPKNLRIEAAYKDPSGETKVASRVVPLWPSDRIVGIRHKGWYATKKVVNFEAVVMDLKQQPVDGAQVKIDLYKSDYYTHRKKLLGGFYSYEDFTEVTKISEFCSGKTSKNGILSCKGVSPVAGDVIGVVTHVDGQSKEVKANAGVWVVDPDNRWWGGTEDHDRADLIPSKKYFEPGEMAEFQLRTPFEESKVLLTIEREGVF
ncbi:MAG: MG2 domain-containing protein, partial [Pseudobdellovibrionaceae bacterium]